MPTLMTAEIVNAVVLAAVLEADLAARARHLPALTPAGRTRALQEA